MASMAAACTAVTPPDVTDADLPIPAQSDWVDYGPIFEDGKLGDWDYLLWGGFTNTAAKKGDTYYLYYQGISGYRVVPDETVLWRAIGVATSPDGINFTKSDENPVLTWFPSGYPSGNGEEGAVSSGVALDDDGNIVMYYGANTAVSPTRVHADGRLATSNDGLGFTDQGIVLDHKDGSVWGSGDELFPITAIHDAGRWFVYYLPNGSPQQRKLGVAWGAERDELTNSSGVRSGLGSVSAWGTAGQAKIGPDRYVLFLNEVTDSRIDARIVSLDAPNQLSEPIEVYRFNGVEQATVILDEETRTWFMYYHTLDDYGVKLAPAGEPDTTPPTAPANVTTREIDDQQVNLSWDPASDAETGIVQYKVFRDGELVATVKGWEFTDTGLEEQTQYCYEVSAVNYHGVDGPRSSPIAGTTTVDRTPPGIASANADDSSTKIIITFDEPVEKVSAEAPGNYAINPGVSVTGASLQPDLRTVLLSTSSQTHDQTYVVRISHVRDRAETPNSIRPGTQVSYTFSEVSGLVGAWNFDEGAGETTLDTSNFGNDGALIYTDKPGPKWTTGQNGRALQFDGVDDQGTIDSSASLEDVTNGNYSFEAWVHADTVPPNSTPNDSSYSALVRKRAGLYYDHNRKFRAGVHLADRTRVDVSSEALEPGAWYHLVMVVDDSAKKLHLYVDGQEVADSPVTYSGTLADHKDAPYFVGASEPLTNLYEYRFDGRIDQVRIYDRALTAAEARFLHSGQSLSERTFLPLLSRG